MLITDFSEPKSIMKKLLAVNTFGDCLIINEKSVILNEIFGKKILRGVEDILRHMNFPGGKSDKK